jgi:hypothetical protein
VNPPLASARPENKDKTQKRVMNREKAFLPIVYLSILIVVLMGIITPKVCKDKEFNTKLSTLSTQWFEVSKIFMGLFGELRSLIY